jgi:hypothetical protein
MEQTTTTSNALVQVQSEAAILAQGGLGLNQSTLKPETIFMVQPSTTGLPKGVVPGTFFDKSSGDTWETMTVVPISLHRVRDKYPTRAYRAADKPTCCSKNGLVPIIGSKFLVPEAPNCGYEANGRFIPVCDFAKWNNDLPKGDPNAKPWCKEAWLLTFIDFETKLPFRIKLGGTSVRVGSNLNDAINRKAIMANARAKAVNPKAPGVNLFNFAVEMTAERAQGVTTYTISFPRIQQMTPEKAAEFGPLYVQLITYRQRAAEERAAQAKNDEAVNSAADDIQDAEYEDVPTEI